MTSLTLAPRQLHTLDAAVIAFADKGFEGVSMDEIAARAGLTKPALYRQFSSKETLFAAAVDRECDRLVGLLFATYARFLDEPVEARLRAGFAVFFDYAALNRDGFRLLFEASHARRSTDTRVSDMRRVITDRVAELVKMEMSRFGPPSPAAADVFATMIVGATEQAARRSFDDPTWNHEAVINLMTAFVVSGGFGVSRPLVQAIERDG